MVKTVQKSNKVLRGFLVVIFFSSIFFVLYLLNRPETAEYSKQDHLEKVLAERVASSTQKNLTTSQVKPEILTPTPKKEVEAAATSSSAMIIVPLKAYEHADYDEKMLQIANLPKSPVSASSTASSTAITKKGPWPVWGAPYPLPGALLPNNRIIAYYGNLYARSMGVLGKYDPPQMLAMLSSTTKQWNDADETTHAIPALDYIAVVAQAGAGKDGKYRTRMPDSEIDKVIALAAQVHGIVILEIQCGLSNMQIEAPQLEKYLKLPQVHLALDPEFAMHNGAKPGTVIGTLDAKDVNFVAEYLAKLVKENNLPPKVLIVHRFTQAMLTNTKNITPLPEVQIVIDMDGFGSAGKKIGTYTQIVTPEPVQFTGFKLFYKNDAEAGHMMTPKEVLKLSPRPSFIQYQ